jgi:hypothetical protein
VDLGLLQDARAMNQLATITAASQTTESRSCSLAVMRPSRTILPAAPMNFMNESEKLAALAENNMETRSS